MNLKNMFDRRPTDVPRTSHHLVPGKSRNQVSQTSGRCPRLELFNICSFYKKQKQIFSTRTTTSEKQFFHKIINFCIGLLRVPRKSTLGLRRQDLQGTFRGRPRDVVCWLGVSYDNLFDYNVHHLKIVANHSSFIPLKQVLPPACISRNSNKKVILLVFFIKCKFQ